MTLGDVLSDVLCGFVLKKQIIKILKGLVDKSFKMHCCIEDDLMCCDDGIVLTILPML